MTAEPTRSKEPPDRQVTPRRPTLVPSLVSDRRITTPSHPDPYESCGASRAGGAGAGAGAAGSGAALLLVLLRPLFKIKFWRNTAKMPSPVATKAGYR